MAKIRESDNGMSDEDAKEIIKMRDWAFLNVPKVIWGAISLLIVIVGFFATHWYDRVEANDQKFETTLEKANDYTDRVMAQHIKELTPFWNSVNDMKKTVGDTHDQVERISAFMEFKYGMPEKKMRR